MIWSQTDLTPLSYANYPKSHIESSWLLESSRACAPIARCRGSKLRACLQSRWEEAHLINEERERERESKVIRRLFG